MSDQSNAIKLVTEAPWSDAVLHRMCWEGDEPAFAMEFEFASPYSTCGATHYVLRCSWASGVRIDLVAPGKELGLHMLWDASFESDGSGWNVLFDFASHGEIQLNCYEMRLNPAE